MKALELKVMRQSVTAFLLAFFVISFAGSATAVAQLGEIRSVKKTYEQLNASGKYAEAVPVAKRLIDLVIRQYGANSRQHGATLDNLANLYLALGRLEEAESLFNKVEIIIIGRKEGFAVKRFDDFANALFKAGKYREALPYYEHLVGVVSRTDRANINRYASALHNLANIHIKLGNYSAAEENYKRALVGTIAAVGRDHKDTISTLQGMALFYLEHFNVVEAQPYAEQALASALKVLKPNDPGLGLSYGVMSDVFFHKGRYRQSEELARRALNIRLKAFGRNHILVARSYGIVGSHVAAQLRYDEADNLYRQSLQIKEKILAPGHPEIAQSLRQIGNLLRLQGRDREALPILVRSLEIFEARFGKSSPVLQQILGVLAGSYMNVGDLTKARHFMERSIRVNEAAVGSESPKLVGSLIQLGQILSRLNILGEAETTLRRALAIQKKAFGDGSADQALILNGLSVLLTKTGRVDEAEALLDAALEIYSKLPSKSPLGIALVRRNMSTMAINRQDWQNAFENAKQAATTYVARLERDPSSSSNSPSAGYKVAFLNLLKSGFPLAETNQDRSGEITRDTFYYWQWYFGSAADTALSQMAARFASGSSTLANTLRERQELSFALQAVDKQLVSLFGRKSVKQTLIDEARGRKQQITDKLTQAEKTLGTQFPEFSELSNPKPVSVADVQSLLAPEEALLQYAFDEDHVYVWAVTGDKIVWKRTRLAFKDLIDKLTALRRGLDQNASDGRGLSAAKRDCPPKEKRGLGAAAAKACPETKPGAVVSAQGDGLPFDLHIAHELYQALVAPVADAVGDKKDLLIVPSGPLTALPFQVLVSKKPARAHATYDGYAKAEWLVKKYALTVLPSVSSLRSLRRFAKTSKAKRAFTGFGDPVFARKRSRKKTSNNDKEAAQRSGLARYFRGAHADLDYLSQALLPLPDTADELLAIAKTLNVSRRDIHLKRAASEARVKKAKLNRYRIVHFATHGLIAGEVTGLAEPALALTVPIKATDLDDGLLTASEVAKLKLDANWVVLSACNTASGDKPGAEALSGLARAFFYAGSRALLVSHWPVRSDAAVKLTTMAFALQKDHPEMGRAEALRQSMLALISDPHDVTASHPSVWAPFVVVGEGAAR